jgi:hypothetical protein
VFRADCTEYGLVVVDISDLDSGVKYGIVAFPVDYMAEVQSRDKFFDWDPVEDPQPEKEPDVVLVSPRPRVLLSIAQWAGKYYRWSDLEDHPSILRLEKRPLADAAALDCTSLHASGIRKVLQVLTRNGRHLAAGAGGSGSSIFKRCSLARFEMFCPI